MVAQVLWQGKVVSELVIKCYAIVFNRRGRNPVIMDSYLTGLYDGEVVHSAVARTHHSPQS